MGNKDNENEKKSEIIGIKISYRTLRLHSTHPHVFCPKETKQPLSFSFPRPTCCDIEDKRATQLMLSTLTHAMATSMPHLGSICLCCPYNGS